MSEVADELEEVRAQLHEYYMVCGIGEKRRALYVTVPRAIVNWLRIKKGDKFVAWFEREKDAVFYAPLTPESLARAKEGKILKVVSFGPKRTLRMCIPRRWAEALGIREGERVRVEPMPEGGFLVRSYRAREEPSQAQRSWRSRLPHHHGSRTHEDSSAVTKRRLPRITCPVCGREGGLFRDKRGYLYVSHWDPERKRSYTCYIGPDKEKGYDMGPLVKKTTRGRTVKALEYVERLLGQIEPGDVEDPGEALRHLAFIVRMACLLARKLGSETMGTVGPDDNLASCPKCGLPGRPVIEFDHRGVEKAKRSFCHVGALKAWLVEG